MIVFTDRDDAGRRLARELEPLRDRRPVILGLPRGGVPVAFHVAEHLRAPLDVIVVRKLGVPFQPELAMGAIGEGGVRVVDERLVARTGVTPEELLAVEQRERAVLEARVERLRRGRPRVDLHGRVAVVVDDGIATGATARVACTVARRLGATRVVLAVPVAPADVVDRISEADEVVCLSTPRSFWAVGAHYRSFSATTDDEVVTLLDRARHEWGGPREAVVEEDVTIPVDGVGVEGHLHVPTGARGVVVFAHGSGSSRHSPRNRYVARVLQEAGLGTLLMDLLTSAEERERSTVFDIPLLADRLLAATDWLRSRTDTASCRIGYFGASTGAAAALWAAAEPDSPVAAVVSRGGRPDLAGARLELVRAPTLLVVGGNDLAVLDLNRRARTHLVNCPSELVVVDGATHLFEEPGTLAEAAAAARDWFVQHLGWRAGHAATG